MKRVCCAAMILLAVLFALVPAFHSQAAIRTSPFHEGERLVYRAKWGPVSAGEAVLETLPFATIQGQKSYHFAMTARSSGKIDAVHSIRERQDSFTDLDLTQTLRYASRSTGSHPRDVVVNFDWRNLTATRVNSGEPQEPVAIVPGTLDPLALIFSIRARRLEVGEILEIPVTDGKKCASVKAVVSGRQILAIDDRSYITYVVEPEMKSVACFLKKTQKLKIWYSADEQQLPVRMQSQLLIGTFVFELVERGS